MNELISIIIPVYNVNNYLSECMESVTSQTYKNLEIILVDDGSTDGSGEACDEWREKDSRVSVIHQKNMGVSVARNTGIEICKGDYIGFVDGDDWIESQMYELMLRSLLETNAQIAMCGFVDYPNGIQYPEKKGLKPIGPCKYKDAIKPILQRDGYFVSMCNKLFARNTIIRGDKIEFLDKMIGYGEDELWLFQVASKVDTISFVPKALYHWRPRQGSATRSTFLTDKQMSLINAKQRVLEFIPNDRALQELAKGRIYNDCYLLKIIAYCSSDKERYQTVNDSIRPYRNAWLKSDDVKTVRKLKVAFLEVLMTIKAPKSIVKKISDCRG